VWLRETALTPVISEVSALRPEKTVFSDHWLVNVYLDLTIRRF